MAPKSQKPLLLLTNDDGFFAEGITVLFRELQPCGEVYIVAPDQERSASSLSLSLHRPLRVQTGGNNIYAISGTPADCVYMALQKLLPRRPDALISGLNHGPNLGQQDISYSGTVAGAIQGTFLQIPSMAVSVLPDRKGNYDFVFAAQFVREVVTGLLQNDFWTNIILNINIPPPPVKGIKITKLGQKRYNPEIITKTGPQNQSTFWIGAGHPQAFGDIHSDVFVAHKGYISVTPLHTDLTDYKTIEQPEFKSIFSTISDEISKKTL